jgi:hydrogenase nickel incorporation protein HypB
MPQNEHEPIAVLERKILAKNDEVAARNRALLAERGTVAVNLMGAPGSGKTRLLEATLDRLKGRPRVAIIEGDLQTDNDARRIARHQAPVIQLVTSGACHLEAPQVAEALERLPLPRGGLLIIENVGNLVCPASFDLGETVRGVCVSVTEGDDKPEKYPSMFRKAGFLVITKTDLLPHVDFDPEKVTAQARSLNPDVRVFTTSAASGQGLVAWCAWLETLAGPARSGSA